MKVFLPADIKRQSFQGHLCVKGVNIVKDAIINFKHSPPRETCFSDDHENLGVTEQKHRGTDDVNDVI